MMKKPTENGGTASVSHRPTENQRRNRTLVCACVKDGSFMSQVSANAATNEAMVLSSCRLLGTHHPAGADSTALPTGRLLRGYSDRLDALPRSFRSALQQLAVHDVLDRATRVDHAPDFHQIEPVANLVEDEPERFRIGFLFDLIGVEHDPLTAFLGADRHDAGPAGAG